jgi:tRNA(Ile)-lysidine synthase
VEPLTSRPLHASKSKAAVRDALERFQLTSKRLVVAVSGGADSVALLTMLCELREPLKLDVFAAHFDHGLRDDSWADADWVRWLCTHRIVPVQIGRPQTAPPSSHIEAWSRRERYAFLTAAATQVGASHVVVAHTADDQAETVLHHILRGTGIAGLAGMPASRPLSETVRLIRPCLKIARGDLRTFLKERDQPHLEDPSNTDWRFTRNAIRHGVLPNIAELTGRFPTSSLLKLAEQARGAVDVMRRQARRSLKRAVLEQTPTQVRLSSKAFAGVPRIVVQEAAVLLWKRMNWPRREMTQRHWQRAAELMVGERVTELQWPRGINGQRRGELVLLERGC